MKNTILLFICFSFCLALTSNAEQRDVKRFKSTKLVTKNFYHNLDFEINRGVVVLSDVQFASSGKRYRFILDSGSAYTLVSKEVAVNAGFLVDASTVINDGFEKESIKLGLADVTIGDVKFSNVGVGVIDDFQMEKNCDIDGIIGYNLMKSCVWKLGLEEIIITDDVRKINNVSDFYAQKLYDGPTVVAGFSNGFSSTMLLDLGDNATVEIQESRISLIKEKEVATGVGKLYSTGLGYGNKTEESIHKLLKVPSFTLGNGKVDGMIVYTDDSPLLPIDVIGAGILNYYNIILDFPKGKFYSINISEKYDDHNFKTHGFKYDIKDSSIYVSFVWDGSSAYKSGLRVGQQISMVNGISTSDLLHLESCKIHEWMQSALDNHSLTLSLAGSDEVLVVTKEPLFSGD